jgi:hypothetical protein
MNSQAIGAGRPLAVRIGRILELYLTTAEVENMAGMEIV